MEQSEHLDSVINRTVVNAVFAERHAAAVLGEFGPGPAQQVVVSEVLDSDPESVDKTVCLEQTVLRHVIPNLCEVADGSRRIDNFGHGGLNRLPGGVDAVPLG